MPDGLYQENAGRILIVDDEKHNLIIISRMMEKAGYSVSVAPSGAEALSISCGNDYFLFVIDVNMPGMNGYETASKLRENEDNKVVPIIFISAKYISSDDVMVGYSSGAVDYIIKPIDEKILVSKANIFFEIYQKNRLLAAEIEKRKLFEEKLRKNEQKLEIEVNERTLDLSKRVRELNCLYRISRINEDRHIPLDTIMEEVVNIIPSGFHCPERTCAGIKLYDVEYLSSHSVETNNKTSRDLICHKDIVGSIDIFWLSENHDGSSNLFSDEEEALLDALSEMIGRIIERKNYEMQLSRLSISKNNIIENERRRVSRDLHDSIGQLLATLRLEVEWMMKNPESEPLNSDLRNFIETALIGTKELKRICWDLRPPIIDKVGLTAAIRELVAPYQDNNEVIVNTVLDEVLVDDIPNNISINAYRIYQEAISNAIKHAESEKIDVSLSKRPGKLVLRISDDGKGFESSCIHNHNRSIGLLSINERVSEMNGDISLRSAPGMGTDIKISIKTGR